VAERLVNDLSPLRPGFDPRPGGVGFGVYEVALGQFFFSEYFGFPLSVPFHQFPVMIFVCQRRCVSLAVDSFLTQHSSQRSDFSVHLATQMTVLPVNALYLSDGALPSPSERRISQSGIMVECLK